MGVTMKTSTNLGEATDKDVAKWIDSIRPLAHWYCSKFLNADPRYNCLATTVFCYRICPFPAEVVCGVIQMIDDPICPMFLTHTFLKIGDEFFDVAFVGVEAYGVAAGTPFEVILISTEQRANEVTASNPQMRFGLLALLDKTSRHEQLANEELTNALASCWMMFLRGTRITTAGGSFSIEDFHRELEPKAKRMKRRRKQLKKKRAAVI